jgi:predicted PurR-regulated permease PerM
VGILIAFILNPMVKWFDANFYEKRCHIKKPKVRLGLSILITYIIVFGFISWGISYVIPQIIGSITDLVRKQAMLYASLVKFLSELQERFPLVDFDFLQERLNELWPKLVSSGTDLVVSVFPKLLNIGMSIFTLALNLLLSIAISIYMLFDKRKLSNMLSRVLYSILDEKKADTFSDTSKKCGEIFTGFIVGKAIDSTIIGLITFIVLTLFQMPYTLLLSVIVGVTNMIPYFGPFIGAVPGVLLFLVIDPIKAVIFAIIILCIQQFDGWVLGPYILGEKTGIGPLWVIFAITIGGAYFGLLGMFLGVPVIAVISYLLTRAIDFKLKKRGLFDRFMN